MRKKPASKPSKSATTRSKPAKAARAATRSASKSARVKTVAAPARTKQARTKAPVARPTHPAVATVEPTKVDGEGRTEAPLTRDDVAQFRNMLLAKRAEILGDVSTLHNEALNKDRREAAGDLSSMPIHMADLGSDNYELEFTLGLIEGERAILKEIDEALDRIKNNTYGLCLATGKPIGKARLKAKPWAKFCYEYTLAQEKNRQRKL